MPENPACQAAVAAGGTQPLYDWYGVLRSDGGGRTHGYIPDGQLCSGGNPKYAAYDAPRADWPATSVRADGTYDFSYGAWVPHPGGIRLYITKDGYDPTKPLTWDDLEAQPFLTADPQPPVSDGAYRFSGQLPHRSGRHVIYSVWSRTDSQETFYGCSDVDFDGSGGPTPTPTPSGPTPTPSTSPTTPPAVSCRASLHTDNSWSGGFQATLTITNTGTTTMTNWYASWTFPAGARLDQVWNGTPMQSGTTAMIHAASWNRVLAPGRLGHRRTARQRHRRPHLPATLPAAESSLPRPTGGPHHRCGPRPRRGPHPRYTAGAPMTRPLRLPTIRSAPTAAVATVLVTAVTLPMLLAPPTAGATAASCAATYRIASQWSGGFQAEIQVTNTGTVPLTGWRLVWSYTDGEQVTQGWNATVTHDGSTVTATNAAFNANLAPAGSTTIGLLGTGRPGSQAPAVTCGDPAGTPGTPTPSVPPVSPTPSTTPSGPPDPACGNAMFCDGFESQGGTVPDGAWTMSRPNCQGSGTATVDTAIAHSGTRSVRVDGRAGYCNHVFVRPTADLTPVGRTWHVRFYVRHTVPLPGGHVALAALRDDADDGKDLRLGGQNGALQWNRESDDATVPVQSPAGVAQSRPLPTDTWNCITFTVDGERGTMSTSVNGTPVPGLRVDAVPTTDVDAQWIGRTWRPHLTDLRLGWESYGGGDDILWFDDVAVSAYPLTC